MLLELQNVDLAFGGPPLLEHADLVIEHGARICVLGRNGSGKSSLLRLLAGQIPPDDGVRREMPGIRIGILPQEGIEETDQTFTGTALEVAVSNYPENETPVLKMLDRLGVDPSRDFNTLSGGLKRRTLLARAMSCNPDLLLLDEPTNHLDTEIIAWLEKWLGKPGLAVVFVSHDRRFMKNVSSEIIELDRGRLHHGRMGFERYMQQREARLEDEAREQARFEKKLGEEEAWIRKGIKARRTRNEGRVRRLQAMREQQRNYRAPRGSVRAGAQDASASGKIVLDIEHLEFGYPDLPLIHDFNLRVLRGDRIGIIGANGTGKTTLINLMLGKVTPHGGTVSRGTRLEIAEFDQHRAALDENLSAADNVAEGREFIPTPNGQRHIIGYLKEFLFSPEQARAPIRKLSGGERARLLLARLFSRPFNLLVMDEPTNDLDMETLELLEEILTDYDGTLLLVSHDREFLDNVTTSIIHLDGRGNATEYMGGYSEFDRVRSEQEQAPAAASAAADTPPRKRKRPRLSYKLQRELDQLPTLIETLEAEIEDLHRRMADPGFFSGPREVAVETRKLLEEKERTLATTYARWEELDET